MAQNHGVPGGQKQVAKLSAGLTTLVTELSAKN
jgi:hypothetical protein